MNFFLLRSESRQEYPPSSSFQHHSGISSQSSEARMKTRNEEVNFSYEKNVWLVHTRTWINLKALCWEKGVRHKGMHILLFYLYKILGRAKLIYNDRRLLNGSLRAGKEWITVSREISGVIKNILILIIMIIIIRV